MNKGKKSLLNAITALIQMAAVSIFGLLFTRTIMLKFGSDYNGINSTVTQIVNSLMILEGGFTLASNVALFAPFSEGDNDVVNGILSATNKRFKTVGAIALIVGLLFSVLYPFIATTNMPKWMISVLMLSVLIPSCYNLGMNMKYRVLILADQKEYIISIITTIAYIMGCGISIVVMRSGGSLIWARIIMMISLFLNYFGIMIYCKKKYPWQRYDVEPLYEKIKGTKSVLVMKLNSMFYLSFPVIIISTLPRNGAKVASVYAVYKAVMTVVANSLASLTNAPRLGFGALFAEERKEDAKKFFDYYEKIVCISISVVLGSCCMLLIPFIKIYTSGIKDINYIDKKMALIMLVTVLLETIHIPSGQIIQMSGDFEISRKIQSISCVILVIVMTTGRFIWGMYGIIMAVFIAALVIAIMEITYTSRSIFGRSFINLVKNILPCLIICLGTVFLGFMNTIKIHSLFGFFVYGAISFISLLFITFIIYYFIDLDGMKGVFGLIKKSIFK